MNPMSIPFDHLSFLPSAYGWHKALLVIEISRVLGLLCVQVFSINNPNTKNKDKWREERLSALTLCREAPHSYVKGRGHMGDDVIPIGPRA